MLRLEVEYLGHIGVYLRLAGGDDALGKRHAAAVGLLDHFNQRLVPAGNTLQAGGASAAVDRGHAVDLAGAGETLNEETVNGGNRRAAVVQLQRRFVDGSFTGALAVLPCLASSRARSPCCRAWHPSVDALHVYAAY